jgi:hypothetical protein
VNRGLTWFANIWLCIALVVNALIVAQIFASTTSIQAGFSQIRQVYDPLDMENVLFQALLFAPLCIAILWRNHRQERPTR